MGADISSPEKQPSTKQSEDEEDQVIITSATKSTNNRNSISPQKDGEQPHTTPSTMSNYLNEENLKHLQRISELIKLNFAPFNKALLLEQQLEQQNDSEQKNLVTFADSLFKKKPYMSIEDLQQPRTLHIQRNKLSDKFNRRDIQFYDLYIKKDNGEDLAQLQDKQFPLDINAEQYYQEMEINDFNHLFANQQLVEEKFGKTIKVELSTTPDMKLKRRVREYPELVKVSSTSQNQIRASSSSSKPKSSDPKDPELLSIHASLKQFERQFQKSHEEIADIFCKVSGRLNKMKDYLDNKPGVIEWSYLEDLALAKPDDSAEFQVLLQTKGWEEIMIRRDFLHASPVISDEEETKQQ